MTTQQIRRNRLAHARLYGIVDFGYVEEPNVGEVTQNLLDGGADVIQLRAKGIALGTVSAAAQKIIPLCKAAGVPVILNDYPKLAMELGADGVHIGQDDGAMADVRKLVGEEMLIGRSTHSLSQAKQALEDEADYIGFGPLFPTPTKQGRPAIGLDEVSKMETEVGKRIPAFCIGGIKPENLELVVSSGARRVVVVSYLLLAEDIVSATATLKRKL